RKHKAEKYAAVNHRALDETTKTVMLFERGTVAGIARQVGSASLRCAARVQLRHAASFPVAAIEGRNPTPECHATNPAPCPGHNAACVWQARSVVGGRLSVCPRWWLP